MSRLRLQDLLCSLCTLPGLLYPSLPSTAAFASPAITSAPFTIASTAIAVPASSAPFPAGRLFLGARPLCVVCGVCILLDRSGR